jgi:hypothetical protein
MLRRPGQPSAVKNLESAARQDGRYVAKARDGVDSVGERLDGRLRDRINV